MEERRRDLEGAPRLAFLTSQSEGPFTIGALLITNHWGRPLEFHVTQPVQPTKLQQILYGPTLKAYLCCEVLAKALLEKVENSPHLLVTDIVEFLHGVTYPTAPVVCVAGELTAEPLEKTVLVWEREQYRAYTVDLGPEYLAKVKQILESVPTFDLAEPFDRLREAIRESRRLGVIARAA